MKILNVIASGKDYQYKWPDGNTEVYRVWIEYEGLAEDGPRRVRIGYGSRSVYGRERMRVVIWIDNHPHAEFLGADDIEQSGEVVSEIRVHGDQGEVTVRYPGDPIPERYRQFRTIGLPTRVSAVGVHRAWAVVMNVCDHAAMIAYGAQRRLERIH